MSVHLTLPAAPAKSKKKSKKIVAGGASTSLLDLYNDLPPELPKGPGGAKRDVLMDQAAIKTTLKSDPKKTPIFRCAAAQYGCDQTWAGRATKRVYPHSVQCMKLDLVDPTIRDKIRNVMSDGSLSECVAAAEKRDGEVLQQQHLKRSRTEPNVSSSASSAKPGPTKLLETARKVGKEALKDQIDLAALKLICVRGVPPSIVSSEEWKNMWKHGNPRYTPGTVDELTEIQIPNEAAHIMKLVFGELQDCEYLTITFDGNTTRGAESVYTIHVITPDRRVYLIEGDQSTAQSHTGRKICEILSAVSLFNCIVPQMF